MIPNYRAPLDTKGYMASEGDWATLVDTALHLANFTGATVRVTFPDGKDYAATITDAGATFGLATDGVAIPMRIRSGSSVRSPHGGQVATAGRVVELNLNLNIFGADPGDRVVTSPQSAVRAKPGDHLFGDGDGNGVRVFIDGREIGEWAADREQDSGHGDSSSCDEGAATPSDRSVEGVAPGTGGSSRCPECGHNPGGMP